MIDWLNLNYNNILCNVIGLTILVYVFIKLGKKKRAVLAALLAVLLLNLSFTQIGLAQVSNQQNIQPQTTTFQLQTYRYGNLAVTPIFFPISPRYYQAVWSNESGNLTAVWIEKIEPITLTNPIPIELAVFNATSDNPVYLYVDNQKIEITREGVYYFRFNLSEAVHCFTLACKSKIFITSLVFAKTVKREKYYISIAEFLKEKQKIIMTCILASICGATVGVQGKKLTKVTNYYFMALFVPFTFVGLYNLLNYYMFTVFGLSAIIAYYFAKEIKQTLFAIKLNHDVGRVEQAHQLDVAIEDKLYLLEGGLQGLINAIKRDWTPINILNGDYIDVGEFKILFYEDMTLEDNELKIICDWAFSEAFKRSEILAEYAGELHKALNKLLKLETAFDVEVARKLFELLNSLKRGESS